MSRPKKRVVTFGEILLRLNPFGHLRLEQADRFKAHYGGAEANVAASLTKLGIDTAFVSRMPDSRLATAAKQSLRQHGVDLSGIYAGGKRLGVYFLEVGAVQRGSKVIYDREDSGMATIAAGMIDWEKELRGADWFHWTGITPALSQGAADACLEACQAANRLGVKVSVDLNYRSKLWQYGKQPNEVMPALGECCDFMQADPDSANTYFDLGVEEVAPSEDHRLHGEQFQPFVRKLTDRFQRCTYVAMTLRASINANHNNWSALLYDSRQLYTTRTYEITDMVDRIGGGDSFMAAIIYGVLTYPDDLQRALDFATAASCLKHTIVGDVNLASVDEVEYLMNHRGKGSVER